MNAYKKVESRMKGCTKALYFVLWSLSFTSISFANAAAPKPLASRNEYGTTVSTFDDAYIRDAIVEKIAFYPQEFEGSAKRIERSGVLVRYKDAVGTILMCHGFMCDKYDQGFLRRLFPRGKYNLMSFDFRAHGEKSEGQCCTLGRDEAFDVIAAARFLKNNPELKNKPLFVYGFSMGAVAAIEAQAKDPSLFKAMILDCPFDSSENILKRSLDRIRFSMFGYEFTMPGKDILQKYAFHPYVQTLVKAFLRAVSNLDPRNINMFVYPITPVKSIEKISVPTFFISCKRDDKAPVEAIKTIYNGSSAQYKKLWITNGRGHFDSYFYNPEKYTEAVRTFLDQAVNGSLYTVHKQEIIEDIEDSPLARRKG